MMSKILERFSKEAPVAVMARLGLEQAISAEWVDEVFSKTRQTQYTRELLFSTVVELTSLVAVGLRPSLHAAAQKKEDLGVSITALYGKVNHTEPCVMRALVQGSAQRLSPVLGELGMGTAPILPGYSLRIVDGNHLSATEKRLAPLRAFRGAALPGFSLVVYDPDLDLVIDLLPCEDAHTQERALVDSIFAEARPEELWMGDRNFCTSTAIEKLASRHSFFLFREHGRTPNPIPTGKRRRVGRCETGVVFEQAVELTLSDGTKIRFRRIELALDEPTEDGDTTLRILTNLGDDVDALTIARLYRRRWSIEGLFGRLEAALNGEIHTLAHPRAALLAFTCAIIAYNVLAIIQAAIAITHDLKKEGIELSTYYIADDVKAYYAGMLIALPAPEWAVFASSMSSRQLAKILRQVAKYVVPATLRKHPRLNKPKKAKGYATRKAVQKHVATSRVLSGETLL